MGKDIHYVRVVPYVVYKKIVENGRTETVEVNNISLEESKNMSCLPVMYWKNSDDTYLAELPLVAKRGTGIRWSLFYVYDDLTKEEQERFADRTITIPLTIEKPVQVYSKRKVRGK